MKRLIKSSLVVFLAFVISFNAACGKDSIEKTNLKFVRSVVAALDVTKTQHEFGRISDEQYVSRLKAFKYVFVANDKFAETLKNIQTITPENKTVVIDNLQVVITAVSQLISSGNVGVKNDESQQNFQRWLSVAYVTLSSVKIAIEAAKGPVDVSKVKVIKMDSLVK